MNLRLHKATYGYLCKVSTNTRRFIQTSGKYRYLRCYINRQTQLCWSNILVLYSVLLSRSQWPRGLRRGSVAARLLRSWVRIPPGAWMFVCCEYCELSGRGLCEELYTRPEESDCGELCVIKKPQEWGSHGPRWAAAPPPQKSTTTCFGCSYQPSFLVNLTP